MRGIYFNFRFLLRSQRMLKQVTILAVTIHIRIHDTQTIGLTGELAILSFSFGYEINKFIQYTEYEIFFCAVFKISCVHAYV